MHHADLPMIWVNDLEQARRVRSWRSPIDHARSDIVDGLMWPLVIVDPPECIKTLLLRASVCRRRPARLARQGAVQALVTAILFRSSWRDPLRLNAELDPPYRKLRKAAHAATRKRRPVVTADRPRQPIFTECRFEQRSRTSRINTPHRLAAKQIAAVRITDRQRITASAVAGAEPTLVVHAPAVVATRTSCKRRIVGRNLPASSARYNQTMPAKNVTHRACNRPMGLWFNHLQSCTQLARAPARSLAAQRQDTILNCIANLVRMMMRGMRAITQPIHTFGRVAPQQLVSRLATNTEPPAQLRNRLLALFRQRNKLHPFGHGTGLFPRHRQGPPAHTLSCYQSSRSSVLPILPVRTGRRRRPGGGSTATISRIEGPPPDHLGFAVRSQDGIADAPRRRSWRQERRPKAASAPPCRGRY